MGNQRLQAAVFLDRDGTINIEKDYLYRTSDFEFITGAPEAIARLKQAGFLVIVVTNQSGVARGYFEESDVHLLHDFMQRELARFDCAIDAFYLCPHHPEHGQGAYKVDCACRKGQPGMLLQAAAEHGIDLSRSFMVGDKLADVEAGRAAGCRSILVRTGYGETEAGKLAASDAVIVNDLAQAAAYILQTEGHHP